jgi:hypothetical protein
MAFNIFLLTGCEIFSDPDFSTSNLNRAREFPPGRFFARFRAAIPTNDQEKKEGPYVVSDSVQENNSIDRKFHWPVAFAARFTE